MRLEESGLTLREDVTYEDWLKVLAGFKRGANMMSLGLADCMAFGRRKWGAVAVDNAVSQLEFDLPTVNAAVAINSIPESIRNSGLTAGHYVVLAKADISPAQREKWAAEAVEKGMGPGELKASINAGAVVGPAAARTLNHGVISPHGIRQMFDVWIARMNGADGIIKLGSAFITDIERELAPVHDLVVGLRAALAKLSKQ